MPVFAPLIKNHDRYNVELSKPLEEKLWFSGMVDADVFVDFGCGDASVIRALSDLRGPARYIGYDHCEAQCALARQNFSAATGVFPKWEDVETVLRYMPRSSRKCLILSSVVHEIFSDPENDLDAWWNGIAALFDVVVIRDMALSANARRQETPAAWQLAVENAAERDAGFSKRLESFTAVWGPLSSRQAMMHFLLKYRYVENWTREVQENYLPLSMQEMRGVFAQAPFRLDCLRHEPLPWLQKKVAEDFGFLPADATHVKMMLTRV